MFLKWVKPEVYIFIGQKEKYSWFRKCGWRKNLHSGVRKFIFLMNLIEFFKESLYLKTYSNSTFLCWKTKSPTLIFRKKGKPQFVRINLPAENRLNGEFYWPNVFHYGYEIQSLTWNLHCRSQNLQPAITS